MNRGGRQREPGRARPLYARVLRLDYLQLSAVACFFLFDGMIGLAALLSLAGLVDWWTMIILPLTVAILVKVNDTVLNLFGRSKMGRRLRLARGVARVIDPRDEMPTMLIPVVMPWQTRRWAGDARRRPGLRPRPTAIRLGQGAPSEPALEIGD